MHSKRSIAALTLALVLSGPVAVAQLPVEDVIEQVEDRVDSVIDGVQGQGNGEPVPPPAPPAPAPVPPAPPAAPQQPSQNAPGPAPQQPAPAPAPVVVEPPRVDGSDDQPVLLPTGTPEDFDAGVDNPAPPATLLERALWIVVALVLLVAVGVTTLYYFGKEQGARLTRRRVLGKVNELERNMRL